MTLPGKFIQTVRTKGLIQAWLKAMDYLRFRLEKSCLDKCKGNNTVKSGKLEIFCAAGRAKLFWEGVEFTKDVGLNTSLRIKDKWFNSSQATWQIQRIGDKQLKVVSRWKGLPISQSWDLKLSNAKTIEWQIRLIVRKKIEIEEKKAGLMVSDTYTAWFIEGEEGEYPMLMYWQDIFLSNTKSKYIGLKSETPGQTLYPAIKMDFSDNQFSASPQTQNSGEEQPAHFLMAVAAVNESEKIFLPGEYDYFKLKISISDKG